MPDVDREQRQFLEAEHLVELHSVELKKELRLGDLVLTQILYIVGLSWIGYAAKIGPANIVFWLAAVILFYIPSGIVIIHLSGEMPLEGGIYQWAKLRFGELAGFLVAWNLWFWTVILLSEIGITAANNLAYALGPSGAWIAESKAIILGSGIVISTSLMLVARRGLALGKWVHNVGGATLVVLFIMILGLALLHRWRGHVTAVPMAFSLPALTIYNLNIFGKMSFGALSGFDGVAVFAGEYRSPSAARSIRQSIFLAAPLIAFMFIAGTACVLTFSGPADIDLVSPIAQIISLGTQGWGVGAWLAPAILLALFVGRITQSSLIFNATTRLPMVAGWDQLLPEWFSRLHPRHKTPVGAILFIGMLTIFVLILGSAGVGSQEAIQLMSNSGVILYALAYLLMFSIPLLGRGEKAPWGVRIAAVCGLLTTLLYVVLSIFPVINVANPLGFTLKVGGTVLAVNAAGGLYFVYARRRLRGSQI
jgi:glutamate:GABA antiporter